MIVGGMPQAVQTYVDTRDFDKVDERKRDILSKRVPLPNTRGRHSLLLYLIIYITLSS